MMVREEASADIDGIRRVHRAAFGRDAEGRLVDRLRADGLIVVSVVAANEGNILGHALFSKLLIETKAGVLPAVALAPVAVVPTRQREGIGSRLVFFSLHRCREMGKAVAIVLGDPKYYSCFGFEARVTAKLVGPFSGEHWIGLEFIDGALPDGGSVRYPDAFKLVD